MTAEKKKRNDSSAESEERPARERQLGNLEVWARSAPIRLAGYEEDLAEPHILPGID
ncbi:hypothetical protein LRS74_31110 [Streptomyces sp. LX-29]|uniref:hypothetical protein n=1 Tax=unclassified Streptomyces TaxID=2593676 RepID=UPI0016433F18|nr:MULTISPECIES: hypothetical protein [unclassified Streptomyces]WFB10997.1 hypothetical protein LRS74_31110 [Streptomyces sp. LX-29]